MKDRYVKRVNPMLNSVNLAYCEAVNVTKISNLLAYNVWRWIFERGLCLICN